MKLRSKLSLIRKNEDFAVPKRRINYSKWIYIVFLLLGLIYFALRISKNLFYVNGYGQIEMSRLNVQELTDIRILKFLVKEGQDVNIGDPLFTFIRGTAVLSKLQAVAEQLPAAERDSLMFAAQGRARRAEITMYKKQLADLEKSRTETAKLVMLQLESHASLQKVDNEVNRIRRQINILSANTALLDERARISKAAKPDIDKLLITCRIFNSPDFSRLTLTGNKSFPFQATRRNRRLEIAIESGVKEGMHITHDLHAPFLASSTVENVPAGSLMTLEFNSRMSLQNCFYLESMHQFVLDIKPQLPSAPFESEGTIACTRVPGEVFISPFNGMVTRIYLEEFEVALTGEEIMNIFRKEDIYIKGFFEPKDLPYLKKNAEVTIEFPDGVSSKGFISRIYSAALPQPEEFQKKYEPTHRNIIVDVIPLDRNLTRLKEIYKMGVKLSMPKSIL